MSAQRPKSKRPRSARQRPKRSWAGRIAKWLGIAGLLGVAAGGVLIARDERVRRAYTPDEIRERLHQRAAEAGHQD
ncbi:hypothetical protein [Granulicoccus sp. GXG6511]|uniref:hypothetical protein n=1 Tax=Granulicoccus sp. GXG6511 TaxID=3381351 RepID=UPI003D7E2E34